MAGETIFIQPILKETLEGVDESMQHMSESIETLMGTDEKSTLHDVVNELGVVVGGLTGVISKLEENQTATAALLDGVAVKLDSQIAELQEVVTATTNNIPEIRVKAGSTQVITINKTITYRASTAGALFAKIVPFCTGTININGSYDMGSVAATITFKDDIGNQLYSFYSSYSPPRGNWSTSLPVRAGVPVFVFASANGSTGNVTFSNILFDYADVTEPDDLIEVI